MKSIVCVAVLMVMAVAVVQAQPVVGKNAILNAASYAYVGLPNSSIAQGSIFTLFGTNLGPASSPALQIPLQTNLGGVTIKVTSGGTTVNAIPIFVGPGQLSAILPGNTPTGSATLTVTYNGQTSAAASFQVVASSFGMFTTNLAGSGPGIITNTSYQVLTLTSALHAGDSAIVWGTGLGASPGDDGTKPPPQTDLINLASSLSVYIGSTKATVQYRGRSFFSGEDQINIVIPPGVLGCHVPVAVQIGNVVSNFGTMPIAPPGTNTCSDPTGPSSSQLTQFLSQGTVKFGGVGLFRDTSTITLPMLGTQTTTTDLGSADFIKFNFQQNLASLPFQTYTFGACTVFTFTGRSAPTTAVVVQPTFLDAGSAITVTGPNGAKQLPKQTNTFNGQTEITYYASLGGSTTGALFLDPGHYTISRPGGTDVGAFSQQLTLPASLVWTNKSNISTINRAAGQQITWTGGDPNSDVVISGFSLVLGTASDGSDTVGAFFSCTAKDSDLQFTIPAVVLLSLPASPAANPLIPVSFGSLSVANQLFVPMTVTGLDFAYLSFDASDSEGVTYQ